MSTILFTNLKNILHVVGKCTKLLTIRIYLLQKGVFQMTLGDRLKALREEKGITTREISKIFNVGKSTISNYENDSRKPDYEMLKKLAAYYDVTVDYLVGSTEKRNAVIIEHKGAKFHIKKGREHDYTPEELDMALKIIDMLREERSKQ